MNKSLNLKNRPNKLIVVIGILSPFIGIFSGIYGINQIENYYKPYFFLLICVIIGFILGLIFSKLIKPYARFNEKQLNEYWKSILFFSAGFIGLTLAIGSFVNYELSEEINRENYKVINKTYKEYRFASPSANWLHVEMNGKMEKLRCNSNYWNKVQIDQYINISTFKSKIGFDYVILNNE